jgi:hypothetical protein
MHRRLFDLQKSTCSLPRLAPGKLYNEEALDVKKDFVVRLFDPLKQTTSGAVLCFRFKNFVNCGKFGADFRC